MGYTTDFMGEVEVKPPLNRAEVEYLAKFAESRRVERKQGPYYAEPGEDFGQSGEGIINSGNPPAGQPGLWCQWVASEDGKTIGWDGGEKFYESAEWMAYIIDHFLKPGCRVQALLATPNANEEPDPVEEQFAEFTFDHVCNGNIEAQGEDYDDQWIITVTDNKVTVANAEPTTYGEPSEVN